MIARVFVRGGARATVLNVNHVENKDGFFHFYDVEESKTMEKCLKCPFAVFSSAQQACTLNACIFNN